MCFYIDYRMKKMNVRVSDIIKLQNIYVFCSACGKKRYCDETQIWSG